MNSCTKLFEILWLAYSVSLYNASQCNPRTALTPRSTEELSEAPIMLIEAPPPTLHVAEQSLKSASVAFFVKPFPPEQMNLPAPFISQHVVGVPYASQRVLPEATSASHTVE